MEKVQLTMLRKYVVKYKELPVQMKASIWFLISGFFGRGISIITTPIFTRLFTTIEYGEYSVFYSWYGIISVIVSLNLYAGVFTQGLVKYEEQQKEYASSLQGLCLTLVCIWAIIYIIFHDFWNELFSLTTVQMLAMIIMIWTSSVFYFWSATQRVNLKYRALVIITIVVTILKPLLGVILVLNANDKVTARILGLVVIEVCAYTGMFISHMKQGGCFFSFNFWKHALKFNLPLIPHYLSLTVLNSADRIMIDKMCGADKAGIYNLAYSVSQIMIIFNTALLQTIEPWLYKKIKRREIQDIGKVTFPSFVFIAAVNIGLMLFAPEIISIFAPGEYKDAVMVIPPIAMSVFFMYLYTFFAVFEFFYEKTKYVMVATTIGAILNILLNYIFIPIFGYYAAGYTTLFCYIIFSILHYVFMSKMCRMYLGSIIPYNKANLLVLIGIFMMVSIAVLFTYQSWIIRYCCIIIVFVIMIIKRRNIVERLIAFINLRKES